MARITIGPKTFAALMREIYGFKNLKVNRAVEKALKNKSALIINAEGKIEEVFSVFLNEQHTAKYGSPIFNDEYAQLAGAPKATVPDHVFASLTDTLSLQYTVEEWRAKVKGASVSGVSNTDPRYSYGVVHVSVGMSEWRGPELDNLLKSLLALGAGGGNARAAK